MPKTRENFFIAAENETHFGYILIMPVAYCLLSQYLKVVLCSGILTVDFIIWLTLLAIHAGYDGTFMYGRGAGDANDNNNLLQEIFISFSMTDRAYFLCSQGNLFIVSERK